MAESEIGRKFFATRMAHGMTLGEFSHLCEIPKDSLEKIESGVRIPYNSTVERFAKATGSDLEKALEAVENDRIKRGMRAPKQPRTIAIQAIAVDSRHIVIKFEDSDAMSRTALIRRINASKDTPAAPNGQLLTEKSPDSSVLHIYTDYPASQAVRYIKKLAGIEDHAFAVHVNSSNIIEISGERIDLARRVVEGMDDVMLLPQTDEKRLLRVEPLESYTGIIYCLGDRIENALEEMSAADVASRMEGNAEETPEPIDPTRTLTQEQMMRLMYRM